MKTNMVPPRPLAKINFADTEVLVRYVTETGKILPRRITGLTSSDHRRMTRLVKQARSMLLMK